MKIALAAVRFETKDIRKNQQTIIRLLREYSQKVDHIVFGESFLCGFEALSFEFEEDLKYSVSLDSEVIQEIQEVCLQVNCGVGFGFIEKGNNSLYSSVVTISKKGQIIDCYRRVSSGWKESFADEHYKEGEGFKLFSLENFDCCVGICGDFWDDRNIESVNQLNPQLIFWPVYTDFNPNDWNVEIKFEYAQQTNKFNSPVLYVNSVCTDSDWQQLSKGGAALFNQGQILSEVPSGKEQVLILDLF